MRLVNIGIYAASSKAKELANSAVNDVGGRTAQQLTNPLDFLAAKAQGAVDDLSKKAVADIAFCTTQLQDVNAAIAGVVKINPLIPPELVDSIRDFHAKNIDAATQAATDLATAPLQAATQEINKVHKAATDLIEAQVQQIIVAPAMQVVEEKVIEVTEAAKDEANKAVKEAVKVASWAFTANAAAAIINAGAVQAPTTQYIPPVPQATPHVLTVPMKTNAAPKFTR
jgi:hypothetical protein